MSAEAIGVDLARDLSVRERRARRRARQKTRFDVLVAGSAASVLALARLVDVSDDGKLITLFALLYFVVCIGATLTRPRLLVPLAVAYLPFTRAFALTIPGIPGANAVNLLLLLAPVAALLTSPRGRVRLRWGTPEKLVLAFVCLGVLSLIPALANGAPLGDAIYLFRAWCAPILFFFVARALVRDREHVRAALAVMAWTTFLVAILTCVEGIERMDRSSIESARVPGLLRQANSMGAFLVYYGVMALALGLRARGWRRRVTLLATFAACARAVMFTFSRGAYLAMAAGSATVMFLRSPVLLGGATGAGVVAIVLFPSLIPESIKARLAETSERGTPDDPQLDRSSAHRLVLWRGAFRMIGSNPVLGVGLGQFRPQIRRYTEVTLRSDDPDDAHNAYLLLAGEMGLPMFALMLAILTAFGVLSFRLHWRRRHAVDRSLALAFIGTEVGVIVSCALGSRFSDEALIAYFWIAAAMIAVVRRLPEAERRLPVAA